MFKLQDFLLTPQKHLNISAKHKHPLLPIYIYNTSHISTILVIFPITFVAINQTQT
jgi:hypothetical protein